MATKLAAANLTIDFSYARPGPANIYRAGARAAHRYTAGAATSPTHPSHSANAGKLITPAEFKALVAAGLDIIANDEWYTTRVTEGAAAARQDAAAAGALWHACGLHRGSSIYVSWDAAPVPSKWPAVDAYLAAYQSVIYSNWGYHVDCYAGTPYLRHALSKKLIRFGWRPNAGSWSGDGLPYQPSTGTAVQRAALVKLALTKTPARIYQTGNYWFSKGADENLLLRVGLGSHLENTPVAPAPAPTTTVTPFPLGPGVSADGMYRFRVGNDGRPYVEHAGGGVHYLQEI